MCNINPQWMLENLADEEKIWSKRKFGSTAECLEYSWLNRWEKQQRYKESRKKKKNDIYLESERDNLILRDRHWEVNVVRNWQTEHIEAKLKL